MKRILSILVTVCMGSSLTASAETELRVFTDEQGRAIEARVVDFDAVKGSVQLEREDGQRFWVPPKLFSDDDQSYIKQWIAANRILSDDSLRISFDKDKVESFKKGLTDDAAATEHSKGQILRYEIVLQNRSKKPITGLKLEYRYFVMVSTDEGESLKELGPRTISVDSIGAGERVTLKTENIAIGETYDRKRVEDPLRRAEDVVAYEYTKVSEDDLQGIWLKIYGPKIGDETAVRDVTDPDDLQEDYTWEGKAAE